MLSRCRRKPRGPRTEPRKQGTRRGSGIVVSIRIGELLPGHRWEARSALFCPFQGEERCCGASPGRCPRCYSQLLSTMKTGRFVSYWPCSLLTTQLQIPEENIVHKSSE